MDRKAVATSLMERGTPFDLLRLWAGFQRDSLFSDLCNADSSNHGELARLQGRAQELAKLINLDRAVSEAAKAP